MRAEIDYEELKNNPIIEPFKNKNYVYIGSDTTKLKNNQLYSVDKEDISIMYSIKMIDSIIRIKEDDFNKLFIDLSEQRNNKLKQLGI